MFPFSFHICHSSFTLLFMPAKIGLLLPRSTEFPAMSFDLLDGFRLNCKRMGLDIQVFTENIGFGEDAEATHARAEQLVMQHDVDMICAYATSLNAEALYPFAETTNKPILFFDPGVELFEMPPHRLCRHITLQGLMACDHLGKRAAEGNRKVIIASSFLDGGYRSSWTISEAIAREGGSVAGHFVSLYKDAEFTIAPLIQLMQNSGAQAVTAAFSSYLDMLFMNALNAAGEPALQLPFYCMPFMADEQVLNELKFPGGTFHTIVPWARSLDNAVNNEFIHTVKKEKNKSANIFHLLGWEAAQCAAQITAQGIDKLNDWSYESPRGTVQFHPDTHTAFAPLYNGQITGDASGKCQLAISSSFNVTADEHKRLHFAKPLETYSRWKNNYLCI
jgi:branched-chain amino acid transport system substrate-binding protein